MSGIRLLVADRSATVRAVLRRALQSFEAISVVGTTDNGHELVELVRDTAPDAVVTDLDLVGMAGRELIESIAGTHPTLMFALLPSMRSDSTRVAFAAHDLGVVGVHPKPELPEGWPKLCEVLGQSIVEACTGPGKDVSASAQPHELPVVRQGLRFAAVGASTGGPGALCELLRAVGPDTRIGIAVVQHIAAGFERTLADWLAVECGLDVAVARDRDELSAGRVRLAPPGCQMTLSVDGRLQLDRKSLPVNGHNPSVETLFRSLLGHPRETVAAILLSGMGGDGAQGMSELRHRRVLTMAQDAATCAIYGMPRAAVELGAVALSLTPAQIGRVLALATGARP